MKVNSNQIKILANIYDAGLLFHKYTAQDTLLGYFLLSLCLYGTKAGLIDPLCERSPI